MLETVYFITSATLHFRDDPSTTPLNIAHDIFSIDKVKKVSRKCQLTLDIKSSGLIKPTFSFRGKGNQLSKRGEEVVCPENSFLRDSRLKKE